MFALFNISLTEIVYNSPAGFSQLTSLTIRTFPEDTYHSLVDEDVAILSGEFMVNLKGPAMQSFWCKVQVTIMSHQ